MSDICKCSGDNCPVKESCYRYTAEANEHWQSYFTETPGKYDEENVFHCDMYWGENANRIWNQLKDITNGKEND